MNERKTSRSLLGRTISLLLTIAMIMSLFAGIGVSAFAEDGDVITISSQEEFDSFVSGAKTDTYAGKTVNLLCDVNATAPIGTSSKKFAGTFDGNGHTITAAISGTTYQALFATNGGTIKNLILEGTISGSMYCAGIVGNNSGTIDNCINNAKCDFTGSYVGGITGFNGKTGIITNCINNGAVTTTAASGFCGGIAGGNSGAVENCYNTGKIGNSTKSFAIMGSGVGTATNCFYLEGSATDDKAAVKTDTEMKSADFAVALGEAFAADPNGGYPLLAWQVSSEGGETHEHTWNDGEVTKEATVDEEGVMTYTCTGCGETKTEAIPVVFPFEYTIENNAVTITKYIGTAAIVEVPAEIEECPVTTIAKGAFGTNTVITEVKLPESVKSIGQAAFTGCNNLEKINLEAVTEFAPYTFLGCSSLNNVVLNDEITTLPVYMFSECSNLSNVKLPAKLTALSNHLFDACESLKTLDIPNSVTLIDRCAFEEAGIETLTIPADVTEIGDYAFEKCENLTAVTLGENVEKMGSLVFWDCKGLTTVVFNDKLSTIPVGTFFGCSALENVTLGKGITSIESNAFKNCTALKDIEIGREVSNIGENAFAGTTVTIHGYVDSQAFSYAKANEINFVCIEHIFGEWKETEEATCTEKGTETRDCECGETETREVSALGHKTELKNAVAATCTKDGYTGDEVCTICKETVTKGEVIKAFGHKTELKNAVAATETKDGYTGDKVCKTCGEIVEKGKTIKATGHSCSFTDIKNSGYHDYIEQAATAGIINGYSDGSYHPNENVSRAQFITMLYRAVGSPKANGSLDFKDNGSIATPYKDAVIWGVENGIILGYTDNTFRPNQEISRAQMATFMYRYMKNNAKYDFGTVTETAFVDKADIANPYIDAVNAIVSAGIMNGMTKTTFVPNNTANRGMAATVMLRMYNLINN